MNKLSGICSVVLLGSLSAGSCLAAEPKMPVGDAVVKETEIFYIMQEELTRPVAAYCGEQFPEKKQAFEQQRRTMLSHIRQALVKLNKLPEAVSAGNMTDKEVKLMRDQFSSMGESSLQVMRASKSAEACQAMTDTWGKGSADSYLQDMVAALQEQNAGSAAAENSAPDSGS